MPVAAQRGRRGDPRQRAGNRVSLEIVGVSGKKMRRDGVWAMKRLLLLCVLSGLGGAAAAICLSHWSPVEPRGLAQEFKPAVPAAAPAVPAAAPAAATAEQYTPEERVNIAVYENVNRSVVNITTKGYQEDRFFLVEIPAEGEGSGVVLDRQGHILTNFHVIDRAQHIEVTLFDGKNYAAELIGKDPSTDVAVLKINAPAGVLFPVVFGGAAELRVGQRVFAIGNPFGLERTMTTGIISSLNRSLPSRRTGRSIKSIIQIDAAINPGNSGGPLLDSHGRMIGMNTAIASRTGENVGVGFAIPVSTIARVIPQLIAHGRVRRPEAGITRVYRTDEGLLIAALAAGGPAERAGLQGPKIVRQQKRQGPFTYELQTVDRSAADLIVAVDGKPVHSADDFLDIIESKQPGDQATLTVVRQGQRREVPVRLGTEE
jgi:S1-C subfamily serine protease